MFELDQIVRPAGSAARRFPRQCPLLVITLVSLSVAVAGCGAKANVAKSTASSAASKQFTDALKYARCMRANGVPKFPDPKNPGGFSTGALAALNTEAPAFIKSENTCLRLIPNNGQPTLAELQATIKNGLRFARCMRRHGVNFPDPGISGSNLTLNLSNVNTQSPAYGKAGRICATPPGG